MYPEVLRNTIAVTVDCFLMLVESGEPNLWMEKLPEWIDVRVTPMWK
jgi:hypothetical protein